MKRTKNKPELKDASTQTEVLLRITTIKPTLRKRLKPEVQFDRFPVTTGFLHSKNRNMKTNKDANIPDAEFPHLFKNVSGAVFIKGDAFSVGLTANVNNLSYLF